MTRHSRIHRRPFARRLSGLLLVMSAAALLICSPDYNPYADLTNARARIVDKTFGDNDSIFIFSAETLWFVVALREQVDSVVFSLPTNRLGERIVWKETDLAWNAAAPLDAVFSLADTGTFSAVLSTYRSNGDRVTDNIRLRAVSPLDPLPVTAVQGEKTMLVTDSVRDRDVVYNWQFTGADLISVPESRADTTLSGIMVFSGTGSLWVSDIRQKYRSPAVPFSFTLNDTAGPAIIGPAAASDTIVTGDSVYTLVVSVVDSGVGQIALVALNGTPMVHKGGGAYIATVRADTLVPGTAMPLVIAARDKIGNLSSDTLFLAFDAAIQSAGNLIIAMINPPAETSTVSGDTVLLLARIEDYVDDSIVASVRLRINGLSQPDSQIVRGKESVLWEQALALRNPTNAIEINVRDLKKGFAKSVSLFIVHDPFAADLQPPVIADITIDGKPANRQILRTDTALVRIIAFDQGSGIDSVSITGGSVTRDPEKPYFWHAVLRGLQHLQGGNPVLIRAVDRSGLAKTELINLLMNLPPTVQGLNPPVPLRVGSEYLDSLRITDPDGDPIAAKFLGREQIMVEGQKIRWTPILQDIGSDTVEFEISDGYESLRYRTILLVAAAENAPCALSVSSARNALSGDTLLVSDSAGADTLFFSIRDPDFAPQEHYLLTIRRDEATVTKAIDTSRTFQIAVDPHGIGTVPETLMVSVRDAGGHQDTVSLLIIKPHPLSLTALLAFDPVIRGSLGADLIGFPLLVRLDSSAFDFSLAARGSFSFQKGNGTELPYEVERWDTSGRRADVWVRIDTLHAGTASQSIRMLWDPNGSFAVRSGQAVFDTGAGFVGVWHMSQNPAGTAPQIRDATDNRVNGTCRGTFSSTSLTNGAIGDGIDFNGYNAWVDLGNGSKVDLKGETDVGMSAWVKGDAYSDWMMIICKGDFQYNLQYKIPSQWETSVWSQTQDWTSAQDLDNGVIPGRYYFLYGTYNHLSHTLTLYRDGQSKMSIAAPNIYTAYNDTLGIGVLTNPKPLDRWWNGVIDEVRLEKQSRSSDWVRLCYESQKPGSTFVRFARQ
jgi:hypothetical protein